MEAVRESATNRRLTEFCIQLLNRSDWLVAKKLFDMNDGRRLLIGSLLLFFFSLSYEHLSSEPLKNPLSVTTSLPHHFLIWKYLCMFLCLPAGGRSYRKTSAAATAVTQKPPMGRRDASTPPPPPAGPPAVAVVRRSQVCLSTFYKECSETAEPDWPAERNGRWAGPRNAAARNKDVDENSNEVMSPGRAGLAGKLQQLLTPTRHRVSVRRAASVDDRRRGGGGTAARRQSRKVAETLLKAKDRLVNATSEVPHSPHLPFLVFASNIFYDVTVGLFISLK